MFPSAEKDIRNISDAILRRAAPEPVASLYHQAFDDFGMLCFWSTKEMKVPSLADALDAASRLKREGNMASRRLAERIEESCHAAL